MISSQSRVRYTGMVSLLLMLPFLAGADGNGCGAGPVPTGGDAGEVCECTGPAPGAPNMICSDGSTGGPVCSKGSDGTCGWQIRSCPVQACKSDADCAGGRICGFPEVDACTATGTCFETLPEGCNAYSLGCACDGSEVNVVCNGLPAGYAPAPLLHTGACVDSGANGGGDGGACCPTGWDLYACTHPDGGAGMACHNPQLGCASSLTCGQGCDGVVTGRCGP
jgi:hypothetical protein